MRCNRHCRASVFFVFLLWLAARPAGAAEVAEDTPDASDGAAETVVQTMPVQPEADEGGGDDERTAEKPKQADDADVEPDVDAGDQTVPEPTNDGDESSAGPEPFAMLDAEVEPGQTRRLSWVASESFSGITVPTPVLVAHGTQSGPTLCLTAAIHGDELNGIEMVRRVLYELDPEELSGTVVGVPIVNLFGFRRTSRYLPDRRDLNRYFPGNPDGSSASRIAHSFFESVIRHCDGLADLHTGSFHRTNLPQLRADVDDPDVLDLSRGFGAIAVLHSDGPEGTLRRAASNAGIPAVTLEAGEPMRFQPEQVSQGVKGIRSLLHHMDMIGRISLWGEPQPVYYESRWVRADSGGILFSQVDVGESVSEGDVLGTVTDPITNGRSEIIAPSDGRVLGMALNQVVIPGFAAYNLGIERSGEEIEQQTQMIDQNADSDEVNADTDPETDGNRPDDGGGGPPPAAPEPEQRPG